MSLGLSAFTLRLSEANGCTDVGTVHFAGLGQSCFLLNLIDENLDFNGKLLIEQDRVESLVAESQLVRSLLKDPPINDYAEVTNLSTFGSLAFEVFRSYPSQLFSLHHNRRPWFRFLVGRVRTGADNSLIVRPVNLDGTWNQEVSIPLENIYAIEWGTSYLAAYDFYLDNINKVSHGLREGFRETDHKAPPCVCVKLRTDSDDHYIGVLVGESPNLLMLLEVSPDIRINGFRVFRRNDVESLSESFPQSGVVNFLLRSGFLRIGATPSVQLDSEHALLHALMNMHMLVALHREHDFYDVTLGHLVRVSHRQVRIRELLADGAWGAVRVLRIEDITQISFMEGYLNKLTQISPFGTP